MCAQELEERAAQAPKGTREKNLGFTDELAKK
jgi:hypothetical protein